MPKEGTLAVLKPFVEANNLMDPNTFPPQFPVFMVYSMWLAKALPAREAAIAYFSTSKVTKVLEEDQMST